MGETRKKERIFHSMEEVDKAFFPSRREKAKTTDPVAIGSELARRYIERVKKELARHA